MTASRETVAKPAAGALLPQAQVLQFRLSGADAAGSPRARADDIATRLAAIAEEIGTLPVAEENSLHERPWGSAGIFARTLLRERRMREAEFPAQLLGEPAWDILLDLFAAHEEGKRVSVSSACIASGVPATTALRYITAMEKSGLLVREACRFDKRTRYIELSSGTRLRMKALLDRMTRARGLPSEEHAGPDQGEQPAR